MSKKFNPIIYEDNDQLTIDEVGNWAQKKYKLVGKYCDIFTSGMKNKWNLIYMDLFSASGFAQIRESGQIVRSSSLISMSIPNKFDHYIFNDLNKDCISALGSRIERNFPETSFKTYNSDANNIVQKMLDERPYFNNRKGNLTFCFIDPFSLNLNFETIKILAKEQVDLFILLAMQMDARRNFKKYWKSENMRVANFTGNPNLFGKYDMYPNHCLEKFNCSWTYSVYTLGLASGFLICMNEEDVFQ